MEADQTPGQRGDAIQALDESSSLWVAATSFPRYLGRSLQWGAGKAMSWTGNTFAAGAPEVVGCVFGSSCPRRRPVRVGQRLSAGPRAVSVVLPHPAARWFLVACAVIEVGARVFAGRAGVGLILALVVLGVIVKSVGQSLVAGMQYGSNADDEHPGRLR